MASGTPGRGGDRSRRSFTARGLEILATAARRGSLPTTAAAHADAMQDACAELTLHLAEVKFGVRSAGEVER